MYLCYMDESGCTGSLTSPSSDVQPLFVPAAIIVQQPQLRVLTNSFLAAKRRYFPASGRYLDTVLQEIKGSDLRRQVCSPSRNKVRHALGFLDRYLDSLEQSNVRIIGRILVKGIGAPIDGRAVYTSAVQKMFACFQKFLDEVDGEGIVIADSRSKAKNANLSHSIFTQKFSARGDRYPRVLEMPTFGHSENHVGLQLADLLCSALLFPMASHSYCAGTITNIHVKPGFARLKTRYGSRLSRLRFLYRDGSGRTHGGITVDDRLAQRGSAVLFAQVPTLGPVISAQGPTGNASPPPP